MMGLACKNAILIVEFARELEFQGKGIVEGRARSLPSAPFADRDDIGGLHRRHRSAGALAWRGREVRSATGITVFAGMIGVTLFVCSSRRCSTSACASCPAAS